MKKSKSILFSLLTIPALATLVLPIFSCSKNTPAPDAMMVDYINNLTFTANGTVTGFNGPHDSSELVIPEYLTNEFANSPYKGYKVRVTTIGEDAFQGKSIKKVVIPDSVTTIMGYSFAYSELTEVTIPDSVTSIGWNAFDETKINNVVIPDSVIWIGSGAFKDTPLNHVTLSKSLEMIDGSTFRNTKLSEVIIPDSVKKINRWAFSGTQLTQVTLPKDCEYDSGAFPLGCKVTGGIKID